MKRKNSNRSFGLLFFVVFLIIGIWPLLNEETLRLWSIVISFIFLILGLLKSKLLSPLNSGWIKFGEILGKFVPPIIMALIYFIIITPIGLLMRLIGKDLLNIKFSQQKSYWVKREKNIGTMKRQF